MSDNQTAVDEAKQLFNSIGKTFKRMLTAIKAWVQKFTRTFILAFKNVPELKRRVKIYAHTKNKRIKRKQQKIIFATICKLIKSREAKPA